MLQILQKESSFHAMKGRSRVHCAEAMPMWRAMSFLITLTISCSAKPSFGTPKSIDQLSLGTG